MRSFKHTILGRLVPRRGNAHVEVQGRTRTHAQMFPVLGAYLQSTSRLNIQMLREAVSHQESAFSLEGINS